MTKIKNTAAYPIKEHPIATDFFIGSDSQNNGETVNFDIQSIANLLSGLIDYKYSLSSLPLTSPEGDGYFLSNGITDFSLVTALSISKKTLAGQDLTPYINFLKLNTPEFTLKIIGKTNQNVFAYYAINTITEYPAYFVFNVVLAPGNNYLGQLQNKEIYTFVYEKIPGEGPDLITQTITDGDTTHAPSGDAVYDALLLKANDADVVHKLGSETIIGQKTIAPVANTTGFIIDMPAVNNSPTGGVPDAFATHTRGHNGTTDNFTSGHYALIEGNRNGGFFVENNESLSDATNSFGLDVYFKSTSTTNTVIRARKGLGNIVFNVSDNGDLLAATIAKIGGTSLQYLMADGSVSTLSAISSAIIAPTIIDGDLTHAPSGNAVFDALALKADNDLVIHNFGNETKTGSLTVSAIIKAGGAFTEYLMADGSVSTISGIVSAIIAPTIIDGDLTHAPSGNAVFDALALKTDLTLFNSHVNNFSNPHNTTAIQVSATPHADYLTGANVQAQLDQTESGIVALVKTDKTDFKDLYQTGRVRTDTDVSVLSISPADTLNITAVDNLLFVNEIVIDTPANKIANFLLSFGNRSFVANATNTLLAVNTRAIFYVGVDKLGNSVYRTSKVYDQDVCYLARLIVANTAGVYSIISFKYFPDLANNRVNNHDRFVLSSGYIVPSGATSISFGNRGVTYSKNSINYSINKFDPNYLALVDSVNPAPMQFLFALPNLTSLATSIALSTVLNPTQWYNAAGAVGAGAVNGVNYQVYRLLVTVTGTMVIQTKASTVSTPVAGVNAIFANRDDALAGLTSVVFPDILPIGDSIALGTFYLRAGTAVNGSQLNDPNDFYFRPFTSTSSSSSVGVTAHDLLSGKNDNPAFQHVTATDIGNWNLAYTNRITSLTTVGASGASTLIANVLNIPNYTLAGLGGQPQLNGLGFVKANGTVISYDNTAYQPLLSNPVTGTGTTNYIPIWTSSNGLANSSIKDTGTEIQLNSPTNNGFAVLNKTATQFNIASYNTTTSTFEDVVIKGNSFIDSVVFKPNGNVGIGTSNPNAKLEILTGGGAEILFTGSAGTDIKHNVAGTDFHISTIGTGLFLGGSNDAAHLNIIPSGNVGIGTITPIAKTQIEVSSSNGGGGADGFRVSTGLMGINIGTESTNNYSWIQSALGGGSVKSLALNPSGGNVGIGTTNPTAKLHVESDSNDSTVLATFRNLSAGSAGRNIVYWGNDLGTIAGIDLFSSTYIGSGAGDDTAGCLRMFGGGVGGIAIRATDASGTLRFYTGAPERMRITSSGNVGIGTASPVQKLTVDSAQADIASLSSTDDSNNQRLVVSSGANGIILNASTWSAGIASYIALNVNGGSVGIGITSPQAQLDVSTGNVKFLRKIFKSNYIAIPQVTQWVKLFASSSESYGTVTIQGSMNSNNSEDGFTIEARCGYYSMDTAPNLSSMPFVEIVHQTYNPRIQQIMITKEANQFVYYMLIGASDSPVNLRWNLDALDDYITVYNNLQAPPNSTNSFAPPADYVRANNRGFTQTGNGYVGIGTTGPTAKLHVNGGDIIVNNGGGIGVIRGDNPNFGSGGAIKFSSSNTVSDQYVQLGRALSGTGEFFPRLTVMTDSGNVGIGTISPNTKLEVSGGAFRVGDNSTSYYVDLGADASNAFCRSTGISGLFYIYDTAGKSISMQPSGGNVGIGTSSPYEKLEVNGAVSSTGSVAANASQGPCISMFYDGARGVLQAVDWGTGAKDITLNPQGGNVAVGHASPVWKFEVKGGVGICAESDIQKKININWTESDSVASIDTYNFGTGARYALALQPNEGNLGIGTIAPTEKLHVSGNARISSLAGTGTRTVVADANGVLGIGPESGTSGRYTPSYADVVNTFFSSIASHAYNKVGNMVTVYGYCQVGLTTSGITSSFTLSLPIARTSTALIYAGFGNISGLGTITNPVEIVSSSTSTVQVNVTANMTGIRTFMYSFSYLTTD